jgi:outer membrane protein, heavy metal efflux system
MQNRLFSGWALGGMAGRISRLTGLLGVALFSAAAASSPTDTSIVLDMRPPAPAVDSLVELAWKNNPGLQAAEARIAMAAAGESRARAWAPPEVAVERGTKTVGMMENLESMPMTGLLARQMIMNPGELKAMGQAEKAKASMSRHEREAARLKLAKDVRLVYWDLFMMQGQWKVNREHRRFVDRSIESARRNYEVGMGRLGDILRAQTESARLRSEGLNLAQKHAGMEAMLDALLGAPLTTPIGWIAEPNVLSAEIPPIDSLVQWGLRSRPEIAAMRDGVDMAQSENLSADRARWGNGMVEGKWMSMDGPDEWSIMAGITIPIAPWSKGTLNGKRAEAKAKVLESRAEARQMENMVRAEIREADLAVETARRLLDLAEKVTIPQADQALASAESAYRAGKMEFMMLVDMIHMAHMAHEERYMAMAKERQGWAALEYAVGSSSQAWPKAVPGETKP